MVPRSKVVKFRYVDQIEFSLASSSPQQHFFSCNSLHDPDETGLGHQPMGYDFWQQLYRHYTVIGSKITVTASTRATAAVYDDDLVFGIRVDNNGSFSTTTWTKFAEQPNTKWAYYSSGKTGGRQLATLSKKWSAKKWFSQKNVLSDDELGADFESSPTVEAYFNLLVGSMDDNASSALPAMCVVIEYIAVLSELQDQAQS